MVDNFCIHCQHSHSIPRGRRCQVSEPHPRGGFAIPPWAWGSGVFDMASSGQATHIHYLTSLRAFSVPYTFLFLRCSGWLFTPGPVAVCCSTQYQTDSSKAAFFCCVPFGYSMLVSPSPTLGSILPSGAQSHCFWESVSLHLETGSSLAPRTFPSLKGTQSGCSAPSGKTQAYPLSHISMDQILLLLQHLRVYSSVLWWPAPFYTVKLSTIQLNLFNVNKALLGNWVGVELYSF